VRFQPGQRRVDGPAGGHAPDAGVAEPGRDQPLQRQVVIGAVDDPRRDAAPGPGVLELGLGGPLAAPGDQVQLVQDPEPGALQARYRAVAAGEDHPGVLEHRDGLDVLVGLEIVGEREVQVAAAQRGPGGVLVVGCAEHHLDAGKLVAEGAQGRGHDLGRRGLGHPDPNPDDLAAGRLLGVGGYRLDLAERPPSPAADRLARWGQAHRGAAARAVEQRLAQRGFQRRHLVRQRGLGIAERRCRPPERPELRHRQDRLQLA
jgi:hypothetical protein